MSADAQQWDDAYAGETPPPWDIGRPQPQFEQLGEQGRLRGRLLDCGCGTGENALLAAAHGAGVIGIDLSARAIDAARAKAQARGLSAQFRVANALELESAVDPFDVVIDSGVFHSFDDTDRPRYVDVLRRQLRAGGTCFLMCFSDRQPGDWGPRRVREDELRTAFADGWTVDLQPAVFAVNPIEGVTEVQAWFAALERV